MSFLLFTQLANVLAPLSTLPCTASTHPCHFFWVLSFPLTLSHSRGLRPCCRARWHHELPQAHMIGFHPFLFPDLVGKDETTDLGVKTLPGTPVSIPCLNFHIHR